MNALRQGFARRSTGVPSPSPSGSDLSQATPPGAAATAGQTQPLLVSSDNIFRHLNDTLEPNPEATLASFRTIRLHWVNSDVAATFPAARHPPTHGYADAQSPPSSPLPGDPPPVPPPANSRRTLSGAAAVPVAAGSGIGFVASQPVVSASSMVSLPPDCYGGQTTYGLPWSSSSVSETKVMKTIQENSKFPVADMLDCFASSTEWYNSEAVITFGLEGEYLPSPWENLLPHKQVFGAIACVNCHSANVDQQLLSIKAKFAGRYRNAVTRCILIDPTDEIIQLVFGLGGVSSSVAPGLPPMMGSSGLGNAAAAETFIPFRTKDGVSIEVFTLHMMDGLARRIVSNIIGRVRGTSSGLKCYDHLATPLDKPPLSTMDLDDSSKIVQMRTLKQRADYMLLLGASAAALSTLMQVPNSSSEKLWIVATLESMAAAMDLELVKLLHPISRVTAGNVFAALLQSTEVAASATLYEDLEDLLEIVCRSAREMLNGSITGVPGSAGITAASPGFASAAPTPTAPTGFSAGLKDAFTGSSKQNALPRDFLERLDAEIHIPMRSALATMTAAFQRVLSTLKDENVAHLEDVAAAKAAYDAVVQLSNDQLRLLLTKTCFLFKTLFSKNPAALRLGAPLLLELLRRVAAVESQSQQIAAAKGITASAKILDVLVEINGYANTVNPVFFMRFQRRLPELCLAAGLRRKAHYLVYQIVTRDMEEGNYVDAVSVLIRALGWAGVSVSIDPDTGGIRVPRDFEPASQRTSSILGGGGGLGQLSSNDGNGAAQQQHRQQQRQTMRKSITTIASALLIDTSSGGSMQIQVNLLLLLGEALQRGAYFSPELRSQVAAFLLFTFPEALDLPNHQRLFNTLRATSHSLSRIAAPTAVPPPLIKSLKVDHLEPSLAPRWMQVAGANFIRTNDSMKTYYFRGKRRSDALLWVAGVPGRIVVLVRNPFQLMLVLRTARAACSFLPLAPPGSGNLYSTTPVQVDCYDLHDVQIAPRSTREMTLMAIPPGAGRLYIHGVYVTVADLPYSRPLKVTLPRSISVEVVEALPQVQVQFSQSEVELFNGCNLDLPFTVHSVGPVPAANVRVSVHHPKCVLDTCEGCLVPLRNRRAPRLELEADVSGGILGAPGCVVNALGGGGATGAGLSMSSMSPTASSLTPPARSSPTAPASSASVGGGTSNGIVDQLRVGQSINPTLRLYATDTCDEAKLTPVLVRAVFDAPNFVMPQRPPENSGIDASAPTYSPASRRILETPLRVLQCPSVEVKRVSLSSDRRSVILEIQNKCTRMMALITNPQQLPLDRDYGLSMMPGQTSILKLIIAKMPYGLYDVALAWHFADRPKVGGELQLALRAILEKVKITEPLEEIIVAAAFRVAGEDDLLQWRSDVGIVVSTAALSDAALLQRRTSTIDLSSLIPQLNGQAPSVVTPQGVGSKSPAKAPTIVPRFPAVKPIELTVVIRAPWHTSLDLDVTVNFGAHDEGAMLAGPVHSTQRIGNNGADVAELHFEFFLFAAGNHTLEVRMKDPEHRMLRHRLLITAEHEGSGISNGSGASMAPALASPSDGIARDLYCRN